MFSPRTHGHIPLFYVHAPLNRYKRPNYSSNKAWANITPCRPIISRWQLGVTV